MLAIMQRPGASGVPYTSEAYALIMISDGQLLLVLIELIQLPQGAFSLVHAGLNMLALQASDSCAQNLNTTAE